MTRQLITNEDTVDLSERHPSVAGVARYFEHAHLPAHLQVISASFADLAARMLVALPDSPELTVGLRKLLEAKDCCVRAALDT